MSRANTSWTLVHCPRTRYEIGQAVVLEHLSHAAPSLAVFILCIDKYHLGYCLGPST